MSDRASPHRPLECWAWRATCVLVAAAAISPIWVSRFLPLDDEPNHLSALYIWRTLASDPSSPLRAFYEASVHPVPYALHYLIAFALAALCDVETAHKLALCVYVLGLPLAASWLCRRTGRTQWLSFAVVPLAYTRMWAYGYHAFDIGLVPCLLGLAAFDAFWERASSARALSIALCTLGCYLGHPIPLLMLAGGALVLGLMHRAPLRAWLLAACAAALPTLAVLASQLARPEAAAVDWSAGVRVLRATFDYGLSARIKDLPRYAADAVGDRLDTHAWHAGAALCGLLLLGGVLLDRRPRREALRATFLAYRLPVLGFVALAFYLTLPAHCSQPIDIWILAGRFAPFVCFFFALAPRLRPGTPQRWLALLWLPLAIGVPLHVAAHYRAFAASMRPLPQLVARCAPGEEILTVSMYPQTDPEVMGSPFRFLSAWVQLLHGGGFSPNYWRRPIPFPFRVTRELAAPDWSEGHTYADFLPGPYGCVIGHHLPDPHPGGVFTELAREGEWSVYRRTAEPPGKEDKKRRHRNHDQEHEHQTTSPPLAQP